MPPASPVPAIQQRATRTRYVVVVFAIVLAVIQYIDRVAISQAKDGISKDLGFSDAEMGWIFMANYWFLLQT